MHSLIRKFFMYEIKWDVICQNNSEPFTHKGNERCIHPFDNKCFFFYLKLADF